MTAPEQLLFVNGVIRTMDPGAPRAEAVVVHGSRIVAVGDLEDVRRRAERAEQIDLEGRLLLMTVLDGAIVHQASD